MAHGETMTPHLVRRALRCAPMLSLCLLLSALSGQAASPNEAIRQQQILQQREEQRRQELERRHRESLETPPVEQPVAPPARPEEEAGARCFDVVRIRLEGATLLSEREQRSLTARYVGRCLTLADINDLVRDITNAYVEKGYITTRAAVPRQDLSGGELTILVIEGKVEGMEFSDDVPFAGQKLRLAFPGVVGNVLNIRDLEQGLDQLNRLPSNDATMELVPGSTAGMSRVRIANTPGKTWRASAGLDNSGQKSTGELQYLLGFEKDNLLHSNDLLSLNMNADYDSMAAGEHQDSQSLSAFYSFAVGYWTVTGSLSRFSYRSILDGSSMDFSSAGDTTTSALTVDRVIHRDADSKTSLGAGVLVRDTSNYLAGVQLKASSQVLSAFSASATHTHRAMGGVATLSAEFRRGVPMFGAHSDPDDAPLTAPKAEFEKYTATASFYRPFQLLDQQFSWSTRVWGQWSPDTLYSAERASIGSRYTVRGFHEDSLDGDSGGYTRNELAITLPLDPKDPQLAARFTNAQFYVGYDAGFIRRDSREEYERGTVQGAVAGARLLGGDVHAELAVSKPLDAPGYVERNDLDVYASLVITF